MQESSESAHVESSQAGRIDGFLFALSRFGSDPSKHSASTELLRLSGDDIAAEYVKHLEKMEIEEPATISIRDFSTESGGYRYLEKTLSTFLQHAMAKPDGAAPDLDTVRLATWYVLEYITWMSDPLGQIFSAKVSINGRESDCVFIACNEHFLVIRIHLEEI
ncbi:hypothetical protein [Pseudomonas nitroreducens]|uniref:hypothetical protein n=1 Tax=Pseudomonas nitroreducens TaxID=46680 RepID=UPI0028A60C1B|nr:hypothetical protein [Pseudomonas nitroreducens]